METLNRSAGTRLFLAGQVISLSGDGLAILAIPLLVLQLTHSAAAAALASAPRTVGYLLVGLPAGSFVDRTNPWRVLISADVVRIVVFISLFLLTATQTGSVNVILFLAFIAGAAGVFFETALAVAVRDVYAGRVLLRVNSFFETVSQTSILVGPAVVGLLAVSAGMGVALLVDAATFVVSLATLWAMCRRVTTRPVHHGSGLWRQLGAEFVDGVNYVRSSALLLPLIALLAVTNLCLGVEMLVVFFARDYLGAASWLVGLAVAGGGLGGIIGAATAPYVIERVPPIRLVMANVILIAGALSAASVSASVLWLAASNAVVIWCDVVVSIVVRTLRQQIVPRAILGRVTSTMRSVVLATTPIGAVLAGLFTELADNDPRPVFLGSGVALLISAVIIWQIGLRQHCSTRVGRIVEVAHA